MKNEEHQMQCACVRWFAYQYPQYNGLLFAVPNGSYRSKATAGMLKAEGVVAGVADLIMMVPRIEEGCRNMWHALCIEMKKKGGYQSQEQKAWQAKVEKHGYKYVVCRSLDEFMAVVNGYLQ